MRVNPIVWLASYPRSGNTFLRVLLYRALYGGAETSIEVEAAIPDVHIQHLRPHQLATNGTATLAKTHHLPGNCPHVEKTAAVIHLIRAPTDVNASLVQWYGSAELADEKMAAIGLSSIGEHTSAWSGFSQHFPHFRIHYDALCAEPERTTAAALRAVGIPFSYRRLRDACARTTKANLRAWALADAGTFSIFPVGRSGKPFVS
ncbi:MAG: sulfotransferase domain-containing protein [bacterium]|nr:sulfotransferase domain-containing protein [bacterium]